MLNGQTGNQSRNPHRSPLLGTDEDNKRRIDVVEQRLETDFIKKPWFQTLGIKTDKTGRITEISGDKIVGGVLESTNWGEGAGSQYDLINGIFRLGGSLAPKFSWNGLSLSIIGSISVQGGSIAIGTDPNAFHVDSSGNWWVGAATYAAAPMRGSNLGVGYFQSVTIDGYIQVGGAALDINGNPTTVNGGKITAGSITTSQLNFTPIVSAGGTSSIVATINASAEGLRIQGSKITIDGSVTFGGGYDPSSKLGAGQAAADVNANSTTINGGRLTAGTVTADTIRANISISAPTINGGSIYGTFISGGTIEGGVFRTAPNGQTRIEMLTTDASRIRFFDGATLVGSIKVQSAGEFAIFSNNIQLTLLGTPVLVRHNNGGGGVLDVNGGVVQATRFEASDRMIAKEHVVDGTGGSGFLKIRKQSVAPGGQSAYVKIWSDGFDNVFVTRENGQKAKITVGAWS